jgi:hypothetical protein
VQGKGFNKIKRTIFNMKEKLNTFLGENLFYIYMDSGRHLVDRQENFSDKAW